jgi:hypothetical protein
MLIYSSLSHCPQYGRKYCEIDEMSEVRMRRGKVLAEKQWQKKRKTEKQISVLIIVSIASIISNVSSKKYFSDRNQCYDL